MLKAGWLLSMALMFGLMTAGSVRADDVGDTVDGKGKKHNKFEKIDANHDGVISRDEWDTWRAAHKHHHHKKDGVAAPAPGEK